MTAGGSWTSLGAAVAAIRRELTDAVQSDDGSGLRFSPGPVEVELSVSIHNDDQGTVRMFVVPWAAERKQEHSPHNVQRIRFTLEPIDDRR